MIHNYPIGTTRDPYRLSTHEKQLYEHGWWLFPVQGNTLTGSTPAGDTNSRKHLSTGTSAHSITKQRNSVTLLRREGR